MSKQLEAEINCPGCGRKFPTKLYRSIWIEQPENRKLIFEDKINVVVCPRCKASTKLLFPFLCTNISEHIAVWYEPEHDPEIDKDIALYAKHYGPESFYATAPRVRDWAAFKEKIIELEQRTGIKPAGKLSQEMRSKLERFARQLPAKSPPSTEPKGYEARPAVTNTFELAGFRLALVISTGAFVVFLIAALLSLIDADSHYHFRLVQYKNLGGGEFAREHYRIDEGRDFGNAIYRVLLVFPAAAAPMLLFYLLRWISSGRLRPYWLPVLPQRNGNE